MPLLLPFEVTHPSLREHTSLQGEIQSNQGIIIPASPSVLADVISFTKALEADDDASPTLKAEAAEMRKLVISLTKLHTGRDSLVESRMRQMADQVSHNHRRMDVFVHAANMRVMNAAYYETGMPIQCIRLPGRGLPPGIPYEFRDVNAMYQLTPEQLAAYIEYLTRGYSGQPLWSRKLDDMGTAVRVLQILLGVPITSPSPNVQVNGTGSPAVEDNVKTSGTNVTPVKTSATPAVTPVKRESAKKARTISTRGRHRS